MFDDVNVKNLKSFWTNISFRLIKPVLLKKKSVLYVLKVIQPFHCNCKNLF